MSIEKGREQLKECTSLFRVTKKSQNENNRNNTLSSGLRERANPDML
jgi:hypothetical protein